jgi:penicillin-binding protein 1C
MADAASTKHRMTLILVLFLSGLFILGLLWVAVPPRPAELYPAFSSYKIYDRNGQLLREVLSRDYKTGTWIRLSEMSPHLIKTTIIREDRRFFLHPGVDIFALVRALYLNLRFRRVTSGGSTITMQVAKFCLGLKERTILSKLREILYAFKLELYLKKSQILEIYLNRAPYANLTYGVESASNFYFRKKSTDLSLGEAAILAAIPKAPSVLDPYKNPTLVLTEKKCILNDLLKLGIIDSITYSLAVRESLNILTAQDNFKAPHFVDYIVNFIEKTGMKGSSKITTTIDLNLQENLTKLAFTSLKTLKPYNVNQTAILVMDVITGDILAMVGSKDYFDAREGQVNGCLALRQPGSSIKPFLYILALESGIPVSSILPDTAWEFKLADGTIFAPRNFGNNYHGPTRIREALGSSFNIPTVYLLDRIGVSRFYDFLRELDFTSLNRNAAYYGLALGLGAGDVTLMEMVNAYRTIAQGGFKSEPRAVLAIEPAFAGLELGARKDREIFTRPAAYIVTDILGDNASRLKAFGDDSPMNLPFPCAVKTGTTKDYRDNWCVGFTTCYVVGVWVGNFDGEPMQGVSGVSGAAPLFRDVMIELHRNGYPSRFPDPGGLIRVRICGKSGRLSRPECPVAIDEIFIPGTEPRDSCPICSNPAATGHGSYLGENPPAAGDQPFAIVNPKDGDIYKIDPQASYRNQGIAFTIESGGDLGGLDLVLDGKPIGKINYPYIYVWPPKSGRHILEVTGGRQTDRVAFRVF